MDFLLLAVVLLSATCLSLGNRSPSNEKRLTVPLGRHHKDGEDYSLDKIKDTFTRAASLRDEGEVTLRDVQDIYYYGPMDIGTPAQTFNILFDTGFADLWIPSVDICRNQRQYCKNHTTYSHTKSSTYTKNGTRFSISSGSGSASGIVSQDNVAIGGLPVTGQSFGEATYIADGAAEAEFDGVLGLAYPFVSQMGVNPPFVNMIEQEVVKDPVFAFYLNRDEPSSAANGGNSSAELVLGGVDPAHYTGDFTYTPVTHKSFWFIDVGSILVGKRPLVASIPGVPHSGFSLLAGPSDVTDPINEAIGGQLESGVYVVDCANMEIFPDVTFVIEKTKFVLHPEEYIIKVPRESGSDETVCISSFVGKDLMPIFVLGEVFMRKFYTVFDMGNDRVGFALAQ